MHVSEILGWVQEISISFPIKESLVQNRNHSLEIRGESGTK